MPTGIQCVKVRYVDAYPTVHSPTTRNYLVLAISSAEAEELCFLAIYNLEFPADRIDLEHYLNLARVIPKRSSP